MVYSNSNSHLVKIIDEINWYNLYFNENAFHIFEENIDKINWKKQSILPRSNLIAIIEANLDIICIGTIYHNKTIKNTRKSRTNVEQ